MTPIRFQVFQVQASGADKNVFANSSNPSGFLSVEDRDGDGRLNGTELEGLDVQIYTQLGTGFDSSEIKIVYTPGGSRSPISPSLATLLASPGGGGGGSGGVGGGGPGGGAATPTMRTFSATVDPSLATVAPITGTFRADNTIDTMDEFSPIFSEIVSKLPGGSADAIQGEIGNYRSTRNAGLLQKAAKIQVTHDGISESLADIVKRVWPAGGGGGGGGSSSLGSGNTTVKVNVPWKPNHKDIKYDDETTDGAINTQGELNHVIGYLQGVTGDRMSKIQGAVSDWQTSGSVSAANAAVTDVVELEINGVKKTLTQVIGEAFSSGGGAGAGGSGGSGGPAASGGNPTSAATMAGKALGYGGLRRSASYMRTPPGGFVNRTNQVADALNAGSNIVYATDNMVASVDYLDEVIRHLSDQAILSSFKRLFGDEEGEEFWALIILLILTGDKHDIDTALDLLDARFASLDREALEAVRSRQWIRQDRDYQRFTHQLYAQMRQASGARDQAQRVQEERTAAQSELQARLETRDLPAGEAQVYINQVRELGEEYARLNTQATDYEIAVQRTRNRLEELQRNIGSRDAFVQARQRDLDRLADSVTSRRTERAGAYATWGTG